MKKIALVLMLCAIAGLFLMAGCAKKTTEDSTVKAEFKENVTPAEDVESTFPIASSESTVTFEVKDTNKTEGTQ